MMTKSVDLLHLRSVVLAGHAGSGKTTLGEHLLFRTGAVQRLGKVDDASSTLDFEPEEQKRKESLTLAVASCEYEGTRLVFVDTPGYPDFVAEVVSGFSAVQPGKSMSRAPSASTDAAPCASASCGAVMAGRASVASRGAS